MTRVILLVTLGLMLVSVVSADTSTLLQPWCGSPAIYFSHTNAPDIVGYEGLKIYPDGSNQIDENSTAKNTLGSVLIDSYISSPELPNISVIRAGLWRFRTFHYVSTASGITTINFTVIKRSESGSEIVLFSAITEDIDSLGATEYLTSYVTQTDTTVLPTDRLVIKVYAESTHSSNVVTHFLYEGTTNTSHVVSPLLVCPSYSTPSNVNDSSSGAAVGAAVGVIGGMIGAIIISKRGIQK